MAKRTATITLSGGVLSINGSDDRDVVSMSRSGSNLVVVLTNPPGR